LRLRLPGGLVAPLNTIFAEGIERPQARYGGETIASASVRAVFPSTLKAKPLAPQGRRDMQKSLARFDAERPAAVPVRRAAFMAVS
jgi:hypothetical protein